MPARAKSSWATSHVGWLALAFFVGAGVVVRTYVLGSQAAAGSAGSGHRHYGVDTFGSVATTIGVMLVETVLLAWLWGRWTGRWSRLFVFVLVGVWWMGVAVFAMHANNAYFLHVLWLVLVDLGLLGGVLVGFFEQPGRSAALE